MTIVMLAAGTSSRMGKVNKLLAPIDGVPMITLCCMNALEYLATLKEKSKLIVVTGYRSLSSFRALKPCMKFVENTDAGIQMMIVKNSNYRKGQFVSAKTGVKEVDSESDFFISLADMPMVKKENYAFLASELGTYDAVRPVFDNTVGHPVLISHSMRDAVLKASDKSSMKEVLSKGKIKELPYSDSSCIFDCDVISSLPSPENHRHC